MTQLAEAQHAVPATIALLHSCSWLAERQFKKRGGLYFALWLPVGADGPRDWFDTPLHPPPGTPDETLLNTLARELREDFRRDGIIRFAVAFPADIVDFTGGPLRKPIEQRREIIAFESHNADIGIGAHRPILRPPGRPPVLGRLSPLERLTNSRYATLLAGAGGHGG
jgi:hypothetical protein